MITQLLVIGYFLLACGVLWVMFFKKKDNKICINVIELLIIYHNQFTDTDKVALIAMLINEVDFDEVEEWQKNEFKLKIKQIK